MWKLYAINLISEGVNNNYHVLSTYNVLDTVLSTDILIVSFNPFSNLTEIRILPPRYKVSHWSLGQVTCLRPNSWSRIRTHGLDGMCSFSSPYSWARVAIRMWRTQRMMLSKAVGPRAGFVNSHIKGIHAIFQTCETLKERLCKSLRGSFCKSACLFWPESNLETLWVCQFHCLYIILSRLRFFLTIFLVISLHFIFLL